MKSIWIILILILVFPIVMAVCASSNPKEPVSRFSAFEGKLFTGPQDPNYKEYDLVLRKRLAERIDKRFGVKLDPQTYSGFDLLEIEALLHVKKSEEPFDLFLRTFPKSP